MAVVGRKKGALIALLFFITFGVAVSYGRDGAEDELRRTLRAFERVKNPIEADRQSVVIFFSFSCPHCASFVPYLLRWADSVPGSVKVRFSPVISNDLNTLNMTHAFFVATGSLGYKGSVPVVSKLFRSALEGAVLDNPEIHRLIGDVLVMQGKPRETLSRFWLSETVRGEMKRAIKDMMDYQIEAVPAVAVAGRYIIIPDDLPPASSEDVLISQYIQLLNGFVSMMVEGKK